MKYEDPLIDETQHGNVNVSSEAPFKTFLKLLAALITLLIVGYIILSAFVYQAVQFIPFETEKRWFEPLTAATLIQFTDEESDEARAKTKELQRIADKLVSATIAKDPNHPLADMRITIHYSNDELINAFAMPGGNIVVMRGLVEALPNENVLAMVIAHEIAHVIHRDALKGLGRGVLTNIIVLSLFGVDGSTVMNQGMTLMSARYSRNAESSADETGLTLLYNAYGNAYGATQLFDAFASVNPIKSRWIALSASHPLPIDRKSTMQDVIENNAYHVDNANVTPLPPALELESDD